MPNFAVIEDGIVTNTILADSKAIAEEITGRECVEYTSASAQIGGTYTDGVFLRQKPFPSWVLDSNNQWVAPVAMPKCDEENPIGYEWDESVVNWVEIKE